MSDDKPRLAFIGAGRTGGALALAANRAGYRVEAIHTRRPERIQALAAAVGARVAPDLATAVAEADLVFLAVPDDALATIDAAGREAWRPGLGVVHHSGLHSAGVLIQAAAAGAYTAALHPLQTFPTAEVALQLLPGSYFAISGHTALLASLQAFVTALGAQWLVIPDDAKPLYHAAAVFASNYVVTCFAQAVRMLGELGITAAEAGRALLPLTRGAVAALADPGLPTALTGPVSRGDVGTLSAHQRQLAARLPDLLPLYRLLGQAALPIAQAQGRLTPAALAATAVVLSDQNDY